MGGVLSSRASVALAFGAPISLAACSSGPISVGDHRVPLSPPDSGGDVTADSSGARPNTFQNLCMLARAVVVEDPAPEDTQVSQQVLASLQTACGVPITIRVVSQSTPGVLAMDGRPLWSPSELGMLTGGPQIHDAVRYLDANGAPVYIQQSDPDYICAERATNTVIVSVSQAAFTPSHDLGIIQVAYEPIGGTFSLNVYGHEIRGTRAAAHYFTTEIAPNLKTNPRRYYVIEWTDQDGDEAPSAGDLYELRGSQ